MTDQAKVKEVAIKLANVVMANAAQEDLTNEEKEHKVIEFLVTLDDGFPAVGFIPNSLEALVIETGVDKIQAYFSKLDMKAFVKKYWARIKHLFGR